MSLVTSATEDDPSAPSLLGLARQRREPWWAFLGGLVIVALGAVLIAVLLVKLPQGLRLEAAMKRSEGLRAIVELLMMLGSVAAALLPLALAVRWLHGRPLRSLLSPLPGLDVGLALRSALLWGGLVLLTIVVSGLVDVWHGEPFAPGGQPWPQVLAFAAATGWMVVLQVTAEEALFRGYISQGLYAVTGSAWITALPVALLFAGLHTQSWGNAVWDQRALYFIISLLLSAVTARAGRLEAAIGIHLGQNLMAIYVMGVLGPPFPSLLGVGAPENKPASVEDVAEVLLTMAVIGGLYWYLGVRRGWVVRRV
ncbi:CPBP family intramembrane glutamic endopeptidase [Nitrospirillum sp. BR 11163]|uniref:CPBP family intramembrane glutamic endopeptidase n=1 Tax=Nitrospirillum sp. BR 11163 TaxID=3104323 RepID=UPI002AFFE4CC|nr:CPBP family intramembrane glutamic endopeptidase [Nitrospirillum sp. BR 11163]MEA1676352.1 CPBP family intramembrane glutamic endopeptidase [Nitrospirillum sp. BR 11163]